MSLSVTSIVQKILITNYLFSTKLVDARPKPGTFRFNPDEVVIFPAIFETKVYKMKPSDSEESNENLGIRAFSPNSLGYHLGQILYGFEPSKPFIIDNSGYIKGNVIVGNVEENDANDEDDDQEEEKDNQLAREFNKAKDMGMVDGFDFIDKK